MKVEGAIKQIEDMMAEHASEIGDLRRRLDALAVAAVYLRQVGQSASTEVLTQIHVPFQQDGPRA